MLMNSFENNNNR